MISRQLLRKCVRATGAMLLVFASASCTGTAKPDAVVTMKEGMPCFSVENSSATKDGIPLYGLTVFEMNTKEGIMNSKRWSVDFRSDEGVGAITISPASCVRYGDVPATGIERVSSTPLRPYTAYHVLLDARPDDPYTNVIAYTALFCLKPDASGKLGIQAISQKKSLGDGRFDVCKAPE